MSVEVTPRSFSTNRIHFNAVPPVSDDPPNLTIVVDTEAQFNWDLPFDRSSIAVSAMAAQEQAQVIYDAYGLRPIYVVDYAVASQAEGYEPLRDILQRHSCVIGAHLHPWINPPIEESINDYNSYGGNLPPELEAAKLHALVSAIQSGLGVRPLYFKAGRYGLGPHTLTTIAQLGFEVDFSILPLADFRKRGGGADFRRAGLSLYQPDFAGIWGYQSDRMGGYRYRPELNSIISIPMTRAQIGLLAPLPPLVNNILGSSPSKRLRLPSILSRLGLVKTVTLTPEGVTAEEQIAMLRVLVTRGYRSFVLHYHSPSLVPGYTPYVRTQNDLAIFMKRIEMVCRYFFVELGGLPKHPADFLSNASRNQIWPAPVVTA